MASPTTGERLPKKKAAPRKRAETSGEQRLKQAQRAAILLKQASDATRLQIILTLSQGERHVGDLSGMLNMSQPAVSHHLALLRHGGIIAPRRQGKNNFYALTEAGDHLAQVVQGVVS